MRRFLIGRRHERMIVFISGTLYGFPYQPGMPVCGSKRMLATRLMTVGDERSWGARGHARLAFRFAYRWQRPARSSAIRYATRRTRSGMYVIAELPARARRPAGHQHAVALPSNSARVLASGFAVRRPARKANRVAHAFAFRCQHARACRREVERARCASSRTCAHYVSVR